MLTPQDFNNIIKLSEKTIRLKRNDLLKASASVDTNLYYITKGSFRVYLLNKEREQTVRLGYTGDFIVALDSFLSQKPSEFLIQAIKASEVKIIPKYKIDAFLDKEDNQKLWIALLENLLLQQMEREKDILTPSTKERYLRVLRRSPRLFQEIPNKYIADYLGISAETLSRLKKS
ncbi:Crp/Fnr family transcriptional regulator [Riemerella anatipestifer]|nr:Crp/Fnr family transcriptional regulator [Riemerella anatipestifer]MDY3325016.1 Crp/Fnr family transcriptional regulator [Riemerella anatipestifer]MDY3353825.1 Crp/Fnr family transcriptional regulator [Riemerella anatipestifer]MDY3528453.1 Crp/Fnr family transcriptional regulator [Riemerella anatipestifer]